MSNALCSIPTAVEAIKNGELVVVVDDDDRENEGDLVLAAAMATPEKIAFMVRYTSGILCAPLLPDRAKYLELSRMVTNNPDPMSTAFTVSVDFRHSLTTGISAKERADTFVALADPSAGPKEFTRPGHVFPLISRPGGVLRRSGHTEAATDLAALAGLMPVGVLSEIVNDDGSVKRFPGLAEFSKEHKLSMISINDLIEHRLQTEAFVEQVVQTPTDIPMPGCQAYVFRTPFDAMQHVAIVKGDLAGDDPMPCRIHQERVVTDLCRSKDMDWMEQMVRVFKDRGRGIFIYLRSSHVDLGSHVSETQVDDAEHHGSAHTRMRRWYEIGLGAQVLRSLGVHRIELIASKKLEYVGLGGFGIEIARTLPIES